MGAKVRTEITLHTIWQALTGELPPLMLNASPVPHAVLDSRDVDAGDLFIALHGENVDAHDFLPDVLSANAGAIICEERGRTAAKEHGSAVIDCRKARWERFPQMPDDVSDDAPLVFIVDDAVNGLQRVGGFHRVHRSRPDLRVIGITGSVGKTTTKELTASVVQQHYNTLFSPGNLNSDEGLPLSLLALNETHERAVLEMGMTSRGEITRLCELARPQVGVVTNVAPVHMSRLGNIEAIQEAKSELVRALPSADDGGTAILNWDDELVRQMTAWTDAAIFRYGLTPDADLWADQIESAGMDGIRFQFHHRGKDGAVESLHIRVPLLGRHSVHTALRAAAVGLVEGLSWQEIVEGMQNLPGQLRLVVVPGINGCTIIDDTYNASPTSTVAALNLLSDLSPETNGRRVAVLGDMLELGDMTEDGHRLVGRRAASVVDLRVTVGELGRSIADEAALVGLPNFRIQAIKDAESVVALLREELRAGDLVLVKGSRAIGMEGIAAAITSDTSTAEQGSVFDESDTAASKELG